METLYLTNRILGGSRLAAQGVLEPMILYLVHFCNFHQSMSRTRRSHLTTTTHTSVPITTTVAVMFHEMLLLQERMLEMVAIAMFHRIPRGCPTAVWVQGQTMLMLFGICVKPGLYPIFAISLFFTATYAGSSLTERNLTDN